MKASLLTVVAILAGLGTAFWNWTNFGSTLSANQNVNQNTQLENGLEDVWIHVGVDRSFDPWQDPDLVVRDTSQFMSRKLDAAKNIVSGLALEDYEMITKNAQDLALLSMESQWKVFQTAEYIRMSDEFRESSKRLREAGRSENVDGAMLAYFEVTLNCVRCHKYIRNLPTE